MGGVLTRFVRWLRPAPPRPAGYLTWAEVEAQYPGEWVLLDEPTVDRRGDVTGGVMTAHNPSRKALDAEWPDRQLSHFAVRFVFDPTTADPDEDLEFSEWVPASTRNGDSSTSTP